MATQICWRCKMLCISAPLWSPRLLSTRVVSASASFSTSTVAYANPTKTRTGPPASPKRGEKTTFTVKKKKPPQENRSRAPGPGVRKAMRKRIVLSNTNALEVVGMQDLQAGRLLNPELQAKVLGIPGPIVDQLRATEAFKPGQSWPLFRRPGTLLRSDTFKLGNLFDQGRSTRDRQTPVKMVVVGERGSGKSVYLLQAMAMAFLKDWIVIHIPEAQDLTNSHTEYAPVPGSSPTMYFQGAFTASLLGRIAAANPRLSQLTVTQSHNLPIPLQANLSLSRLCALGSSDSTVSYQVFNALIAELTGPSRPPLLITLDGLQHVMRDSSYMSPSFTPIHTHDFHLPRWFLSYLSGVSQLPNGGAVLAATTESNAPSVPTFSFRLKQLEMQQALNNGAMGTQSKDPAMPFLLATGQEPSLLPQPDPYYKYDPRVLDVFAAAGSTNPNSVVESKTSAHAIATSTGIEIRRLKGLNREEARGLMEYWALSGIFRREINERLVGEKWALSGGGILGELERGCLSMRV